MGELRLQDSMTREDVERLHLAFSPRAIRKTLKRCPGVKSRAHWPTNVPFTRWHPRSPQIECDMQVWVHSPYTRIHEFAHALTIVTRPWYSLVAPTWCHEAIAAAAVFKCFPNDPLLFPKRWLGYWRGWETSSALRRARGFGASLSRNPGILYLDTHFKAILRR